MIEDVLMTSIPWVMVGCFLAAVGHAIAATLGESQHWAARAWHRTRALHPLAVGMALGLGVFDLPVPPAMGESSTLRLIWYGTAGGLAVPIYEWVKREIARRAA